MKVNTTVAYETKMMFEKLLNPTMNPDFTRKTF